MVEEEEALLLEFELPVDTGCTVVKTDVDTTVLSTRLPPLVTIPTNVEREVDVIVVNWVDVEPPEVDALEFDEALLLALALLLLLALLLFEFEFELWAGSDYEIAGRRVAYT